MNAVYYETNGTVGIHNIVTKPQLQQRCDYMYYSMYLPPMYK